MAIDSSKIKELRERTGLPMMECKKALEEAGGDLEKAIENLRKAGARAQEKLAGREANQGLVGSHVSKDGRLGVLAALCCETEPVAKTDLFVEFSEQLTEAVAKDAPSDDAALLAAKLPAGETVADGLKELVNQLRENISPGRFARFEGDSVVQYVHFDKRKAAMVLFKGGSVSDEKVAELGKDLCMQIVFTRPKALKREDLDPGYLAKEREIRLAAVKNDPKNAKKPPEILEKIVEGQMNKLAKEVCLLDQPFVKDDKKSVAKHIESSGAGVTVGKFAYVATDL